MKLVMIRDTSLERIARAISIKTKSIERKVPRSTDRVLEKRRMRIRPITVRVAMEAPLRLTMRLRSKR